MPEPAPLSSSAPMPAEVLIDTRLGATAVRAYGVLRLLGPAEGAVVTEPIEGLGVLLGVNRGAVRLAIDELERFGYVRRGGTKRGRSAIEILPIPVDIPAMSGRKIVQSSPDKRTKNRPVSGPGVDEKSSSQWMKNRPVEPGVDEKSTTDWTKNRPVEISPPRTPPKQNSNTDNNNDVGAVVAVARIDDEDDEPFLPPADAPFAPVEVLPPEPSPSPAPPIRNDRGLVEDAADYADRHWPDTNLASMVRNYGGIRARRAAYWVGDLQAALIEMRRWALTKHVEFPWKFLQTILAGYAEATGGEVPLYDPPRPAMPRHDEASPPSPPRRASGRDDLYSN